MKTHLSLSSAEAKRVVAAAIMRAHGLNAQVSVAVCNSDGRLIAFRRMAGAAAATDRTCISMTLAAAASGPRIPNQGAIPIVRDGVVWGACGVNGADSGERDDDCARAGIAVLS